MAFPTLASVTDTDFGTSVTSMAVNMPATVDSGDRLIAIVHVRNAGTWNTVPTNWSNLGEQAGGGGVGELSIFEKIADGTEDGGTATWVTSAGTTAAWQVLRITGAHASTASELTFASGDASAANPPSETASWGGTEDNLWLAVAGHSAASTSAWSAAPTNYSGFALNGASSGGAAISTAHGYRQLAADTEDPGTFTVSGSNRWWATATVVVRTAAAAGTTVTPSTASLTLSTFAPTVSVTDNKTVTPTTASLSLTSFAPTITVSDNKIVTPTTAELVLSTFAPTVTASDHILVTPTTASLTLTTYEPTVAISDNQTATPTTATLELTTFAPTVSITDNITVTPSTASLTTTTYEPTVTTTANVTVTPTTAELVISTFAPSVSVSTGSVTVIPSTASLSITTYAPDVYTSVRRRNYYMDLKGNVYWVINQDIGLVEKV
jgi:hypothetical protein